MLVFSRDVIDLGRVEGYVKATWGNEHRPWFRNHDVGWFLEQTIYALELSYVELYRLSERYMVGLLPEPEGIVCGHYCTRARLDMYRSAYPRLWKEFRARADNARKKEFWPVVPTGRLR